MGAAITSKKGINSVANIENECEAIVVHSVPLVVSAKTDESAASATNKSVMVVADRVSIDRTTTVR